MTDHEQTARELLRCKCTQYEGMYHNPACKLWGIVTADNIIAAIATPSPAVGKVEPFARPSDPSPQIWDEFTSNPSPAQGDVAELTYGYMRSGGLCDFKQLREAVSEANCGVREDRDPPRTDQYPGHMMVKGVNYNSLDRIVTAFVDTALRALQAERGELHRNLETSAAAFRTANDHLAAAEAERDELRVGILAEKYSINLGDDTNELRVYGDEGAIRAAQVLWERFADMADYQLERDEAYARALAAETALADERRKVGELRESLEFLLNCTIETADKDEDAEQWEVVKHMRQALSRTAQPTTNEGGEA